MIENEIQTCIKIKPITDEGLLRVSLKFKPFRPVKNL